MAELAEFLARAARTPFAWDSFNCGLMLCDWVRERRGVDPAAHLRGRYVTQRDWARLIVRSGGFEALLDRVFSDVGLARRAPDDAQAGDVGLVEGLTAEGVNLGGAICTGRRWALLAPRGLSVAPLTPIAAWEV